ncbi:NADH-quinone oxidoreductase subunit N [Leptospira wolffii]|uniref:NADH-quinone oxidoreductase subunit N n=1 Tax=Leptospira wolffii TaxID=409998 RepID=A0A2M9ZGY6_9LEPT|nr:NADH-quinone oxidoreductase subunit N [Leptospira wolffii]EPG64077.1 proton-translocating NADH-quinone oxidoreductase, chain N [Leptospira wolffii serovar Khorat str. Khorat-H2]PJZ67665.1 NADH-quinone oxidoreductase subunit N [Leptospira wolffii]TGK62674.1 NADH-quinone oxidoreductase subunit N [Leptospira wolffii]TGK65648.1 NADH-quinone oxidoreductase subunit N [Leptospira wolffii]TGK73939.1 NADH-quinone oxidoreductase subunit N [Leptospira wolffii]
MNLIPNSADLFAILPILVLSGGGILLLVLQFIFHRNEFRIVRFTSGLVLLAAIASLFYSTYIFPRVGSYFGQHYEIDSLGFWFGLLYLVSAFATVLASPRALEQHKMEFPEFYPLLLFSVVGMFLMTSGTDTVTVFVGLELMSICLYVLVGMARSDIFSLEASLKYFLLGCFSTGFFLMGMAFLFGGSGTTHLGESLKPLVLSGFDGNFTKIGLLLLLTGIAFKIALFPYHSWTPDAYEGALTPVTGFMATASKSASMGLLLSVFLKLPEPVQGKEWTLIMGILALLSMTFGNFVALRQTGLKRVLAFSSIAHAGYVVAGISLGIKEESLFYLIVYSFMSLGAFSLLSFLEEGNRQVTYDSIAGLAKTRPWTSLALFLFFLSLAGIPPLGGFWAKLFLFQKIAEKGDDFSRLLLIGGIANSALALYYYVKVGIVSYMSSEDGEIAKETAPKRSYGIIFVSGFSLAAILVGWFFLQPKDFTDPKLLPKSAELRK